MKKATTHPMTYEEYESLVKRLSMTMPKSGARREARKEFAASHPGLKGKALDRALKGESLNEQVASERRKMEASEQKERRTRSADPNSNRSRALAAAVKVMKRANKPLKRSEIDERIPEDLGLTTKQRVSSMVNDAQVAGRVIDGYRITRPERAMYGVEKVEDEA